MQIPQIGHTLRTSFAIKFAKFTARQIRAEPELQTSRGINKAPRMAATMDKSWKKPLKVRTPKKAAKKPLRVHELVVRHEASASTSNGEVYATIEELTPKSEIPRDGRDIKPDAVSLRKFFEILLSRGGGLLLLSYSHKWQDRHHHTDAQWVHLASLQHEREQDMAVTVCAWPCISSRRFASAYDFRKHERRDP